MVAHRKAKKFKESKTCPVCQRPFVWRKKWRNNWDRVIYCSDACRAKGRAEN